MMRTFIEARTLVHQRIQDLRDNGGRGKIDAVDFVLCEDFRTVMIYVDVDDELDATAIYFDLNPGEVFDWNRYRRDFFRPMAVES